MSAILVIFFVSLLSGMCFSESCNKVIHEATAWHFIEEEYSMLFIMHARLLICTCMVLMTIVDGHYIGMLVQCNPDLIPSVPSGSQVFINQPITIQCTTMGSQLLAWRSVEYIGPGQQLTFNLNSMSGDTHTSSVGAVATFIRVANSHSGLMLQSVLHISVVSTFTNFTVTCRNIDTGSEESVTYHNE